MSKYPEQIWAYAGAFKLWREKYPEHATSRNPTEYIRSDVAQAMVAAALAEWVAVRSDTHGVSGYHLNEDVAYWDEFDLPETPDDARAALDAMLAKAREDTLQSIEEIVRSCIYHDAAGTGFDEEKFEDSLKTLKTQIEDT